MSEWITALETFQLGEYLEGPYTILVPDQEALHEFKQQLDQVGVCVCVFFLSVSMSVCIHSNLFCIFFSCFALYVWLFIFFCIFSFVLFSFHIVTHKSFNVIKFHLHPPTHSIIHPPTHSIIHPPTHSIIHPPTHSIIHPPTHSIIHPPTHSIIHPPTHSIIHPPTPSNPFQQTANVLVVTPEMEEAAKTIESRLLSHLFPGVLSISDFTGVKKTTSAFNASDTFLFRHSIDTRLEHVSSVLNYSSEGVYSLKYS